MKNDISSIDELIGELCEGRVIIMVDDAGRENEGDLIVAAEKVTPEHINFMATHGRGLICMPMARSLTQNLALPPMVDANQSSQQTAFTVSIGAKRGITTGISAADRAYTIRTAIAADSTAEDLVRPGHVFPLCAKDGGVMERPGHTEAAVDLAQLCGFVPAGVICEIMNPDGQMARMDDLIAFSKLHQIKIGTIKDLIEYQSNFKRILSA